jgi:hypothetical protein
MVASGSFEISGGGAGVAVSGTRSVRSGIGSSATCGALADGTTKAGSTVAGPGGATDLCGGRRVTSKLTKTAAMTKPPMMTDFHWAVLSFFLRAAVPPPGVDPAGEASGRFTAAVGFATEFESEFIGVTEKFIPSGDLHPASETGP